MPAWLPLLVLFTKPMSPDPALHKVEVHIAGPLAMVDVWRTVEANVRTAGDRQVGTFFDLDLPAGSALLDWEMIDRGKPERLSRQSELDVNAALAAGLRLRRLSPPARSPDEGTDFRIHLTPLADGERGILHYRYSALGTCQEGHLVLRVPQSQEETPVPVEVRVTIEPVPDGNRLTSAVLAGKPADLPAAGRNLVMRATVPPRPDWEVAWSYAKPAVAAAALVPGVTGAGRRARAVPQYEVAGLVCRTADEPAPKAPERVVLLVDRSRSVGQGGLSAERGLGRALLEALPPSVRFDAILFGGTVEPVFALPRMPTREALDAFMNVADPNRLENGTDVTAGLARARARLSSGDGVAWVVMLTDGALPPSQTLASMHKALAGAGKDPKVLVLLVRQHGDEAVPPSVLHEYVRLVSGFGGLVRVVPPGSPSETARELVLAMSQGGDWLDLRVEDARLADAVPPGRGAGVALTTSARLPGDRRLRMSGRSLDGDWQVAVKPASVKREWLDALVDRSPVRRAWSGATSGMAVAVLPGPVPSKPADATVRGRMDPAVLRNALALAFTPRARACYVSRRVAKAGDAYLRGRLKLELNLERGELHDAVVRSSTLENPAVERCVRDAAWAVEYPRPEHRDAPTIANVNLVFSPRTGPETPPDASATDKEIELILGPLTSPNDFKDLLDAPDAGKSSTAKP